MTRARDRFFLGGRDLEMLEIARLLEAHAPGRYCDKKLSWGAKLSSYRHDLASAFAANETPVLIELVDDLPPDAFDRARAVTIDHHGPLAGQDRPTALDQIFARLALPASMWTRRLALVSANDRGHVAAMQALGASATEMANIRAQDRAAQGVTAADEAEAERAVAARHVEGRLTVAETTSATSSAIADKMNPVLGGPGFDRLLVVMPEKLAAFGDGAMISALADAFPGSWWGGDLPVNGFWGIAFPADLERRARLSHVLNLAR